MGSRHADTTSGAAPEPLADAARSVSFFSTMTFRPRRYRSHLFEGRSASRGFVKSKCDKTTTNMDMMTGTLRNSDHSLSLASSNSQPPELLVSTNTLRKYSYGLRTIL